ncbi:hypothetical protein GWK47_053381 [Chionoecetes opilio]|uniref:Uncharacterized protein n=1 Tax=Chionoecetes opilio TaxID=41210 RepID=A0A8J4Y108_CHIOP|nr:hypothetical protein GWK47_053381 [Chionoecetes opilio]
MVGPRSCWRGSIVIVTPGLEAHAAPLCPPMHSKPWTQPRGLVVESGVLEGLDGVDEEQGSWVDEVDEGCMLRKAAGPGHPGHLYSLATMLGGTSGEDQQRLVWVPVPILTPQ